MHAWGHTTKEGGGGEGGGGGDPSFKLGACCRIKLEASSSCQKVYKTFREVRCKLEASIFTLTHPVVPCCRIKLAASIFTLPSLPHLTLPHTPQGLCPMQWGVESAYPLHTSHTPIWVLWRTEIKDFTRLSNGHEEHQNQMCSLDFGACHAMTNTQNSFLLHTNQNTS
jgi:hypothetical protein